MSSDPLDCSGAWDGVFNYARGMPPNGFRAELVDHAGAISGETYERSDSPHDRGQTVVALLDGRRDGSAVTFTKRYDDLDRAHYQVMYVGRLSPDGDEITGEWDIPGVWSGTFLMVRHDRRGVAEQRERAEVVR